jgi:hypothetical protein
MFGNVGALAIAVVSKPDLREVLYIAWYLISQNVFSWSGLEAAAGMRVRARGQTR